MTYKKYCLGLLVLCVAMAILTACKGESSQPNPVLRENLVYSRQPDVEFMAKGKTNSILIDPNHRQGIEVDDAVTVLDKGQARLRFSDYLVLDLYRNTKISEIQYSSSVDPDAPPAYRLRLEGGSVFSNLNTQEIGGDRLRPEFRIDTDWAVIKALGTRFWTYYDKDREITWVVVKEGEVSVTGAGVEVIVPAGFQTWVEPGKPPVDPMPACRNLIGDLFPLIDDLTNQDRKDLELLCQEGQMPGMAQPVTPTVTIAPATPTATRRPGAIQTRVAATAVPPTALPPVVCPSIQLSSPNDGAIFMGTGQDVALAWVADRPLASNEYYVVTSTFDHNGEIWTDTQETTQTGLVLPVYLKDLVTGARQLQWNVSVWRKDAAGTGTQVCPASSSRHLNWENEPPPTEEPTPEPTLTKEPTPTYSAEPAIPASPRDLIGMTVILGAGFFLAMIWIAGDKYEE